MPSWVKCPIVAPGILERVRINSVDVAFWCWLGSPRQHRMLERYLPTRPQEPLQATMFNVLLFFVRLRPWR